MPQSSSSSIAASDHGGHQSSQDELPTKTLQLLSQFLAEEQEQRKALREENNLHTTWKDLQKAYETVGPGLDASGDPNAEGYGVSADGALLMEGGHGKDEVEGLGQYGVDALGLGELSKKLALAASPFMGSPDQMTLKEQKLRKQRKKKRKDARKEAKKQAKLQAKMMMGSNSRF